MDRRECVTFTNMCMVYDDKGNVLVQNRLNDNWTGIAFPGGHVEKAESFTQAVIREVYEETGLTINCPQLCGVKDWYDESGRYVVLFYKTNKFSGNIASSDEGEVCWMKIEELSNAKLAAGMGKMLRVFLDENLSEYYFFQEDGVWKEKII